MENLNKIRVRKAKNGLNMGIKNGDVEPVAIPSLSSQMQLWSVIGEEQTFHSNVTLLFPFFLRNILQQKVLKLLGLLRV